MDFAKKSIELHRKHKGKLEIKSKVELKSKDDLSLAYTPGVAAVCTAIGQARRLSYELTNRGNQVAVVSDGTAILGLGNLGPEAAMPVMEGKAIIFKEFADIDAIPLCINTTDVDEIVNFCKQIEPTFAGINLEDIAAPRCFEILDRLEKELSIPVFHDDQDGTAIVSLAALINACRVTGKAFNGLRVVVNGAGAAGLAIAKLLLHAKVREVIIVDSMGVIFDGRVNLNSTKAELAKLTNPRKVNGQLTDALAGADVFIGVSQANVLGEEAVRLMAPEPIILAMANPVPEIMPESAYRAGASIVGTGRSDLPNQVNNALVFPGLFRGLLDARLKIVTAEMKMAAALAISDTIEPSKERLLPSVLDKKVVKNIRNVFMKFSGKGE